uniref:Ciliary rootlet coiled-coil, rootletin n=1 Tax=Oncorhynchus kisutch TaxID=8019 RepID=A0A8C7GH56_ONCKI
LSFSLSLRRLTITMSLSPCQRVEESVLSEEKRLTVRGASPEDPTTCLPARVREIVTKNLNESSPGTRFSVMSVQEENRVLQVELGRLEDLLAHSKADRDELAIKYSAISERLEHALCLETGEGEQDSAESRSLAQQNVDLRRRLDEEQAAYKRKLTAYQEGQQRQAQLVQKLQAKVLQYKKRCGDLEQTLVEKSSELEQHRLNILKQLTMHLVDPCCDLENALIRLDEEQQRSSSLSAVNAMLREQLEQAGLANEALSQDIRRLTADWSKSREELEQRESDWRREEESFHSYFSSEHSRLLCLWRQVVGFLRQVSDLKSATERDLSDMRNELVQTSHSIQSSCSGLSSTMHNREGGVALALEREVALRGQLELQLRERVAEMMSLQTRTDAERAELNARSGTELNTLLSHWQSSSSLLYYNVTLSNFPIQTFPIKVVLSLNSSVSLSASSVQCPTLSSLSGPQEVRGCLSSAHSSLQTLRRQLAEAESAKREAEQRSRTLQGERDGFQIEKDTTQRERERLKQDRDTLARYNQESPQSSNAELSLLVNKLHSEEAALQDSLAKMGSMNEGLAQDKSDLNSIICQLEEEKAHLHSQKREAEQEKLTIRDELVRVEQDRLELDTARLALHQSLQESELSRVVMEAELQSLRADRVKLQDKVTQLCGEVSSLGAELGMARGEEQRQGVALEEVGRGRVELARERAGLVVQLTASERENTNLTEELATFRSEREALETSLFEEQQQLVQLESGREQLETEIQSLRLRCETNTVVRVLYLGWSGPYNEHQQRSVFVLQEALRHSLESEQEGALLRVRQEAEEQHLRAERDREDLRDEVRSLQHDRDQSLLQAETEKQQASVGALTIELLELRSQLEDTDSVHDRELHRLQENCTDLQTHTDIALKELEECRASLSASEESRDQVRRDMMEIERRLNQTRDTGEGYRRDGVELRRTLGDVTKERDTLSLSNAQLRETLRSADTERISIYTKVCNEKEQRLAVLEESLSSAQREVAELRSCLREVERSRLEARRELQEIRRQVKVLDGEKEQKGKEVAELQIRLSLEEQREEERGRAMFSLKQKLVELSILQRRLTESESGCRGCERELTAQLQEARGCEKKLQDEARNLSLRAQTAQDSLTLSSLQLSEAQGRLAATEAELARSDAGRRELEFRLGSLQSALTRTLGIGVGGRSSASWGRSPRGSSPAASHSNFGGSTPDNTLGCSRQISPERGDTPLPMPLPELDPETLRCGLRDFLQELRDSRRERRGVDGRLSSTQAMLQQQEETVRRGERERRALTDRVKVLERALQTAETERKHTQDQLSKQRAGEVRLEAERRRLQEALETAEARGTRVELGRRSLEGELHRLKLSLGDREAESQATQERHDVLLKQVSRVTSLQRELERLSQALSKVHEGEACLREKTQNLSQSLQEATAAHSATQGRLVALQKTLGLAEQDRRHLQERVDVARASLAEGKRGMVALTERVQSLQTELTQSELRRGELEAELAHTQEVIEMEKKKERLRGLQRAVAVLETEKKDAERQAVRLEKDKNALRNTLEKVERQKLKTEEGSMRLSAEKGLLDRSLTTAEQELQNAQRQIAQLAEMEQSHSESESSVLQHDEVLREAEKLRVAQRGLERILAARDRAHRHRVKGLEEQVSTLKEQLQQEMSRRQPSLPTSLISGGN